MNEPAVVALNRFREHVRALDVHGVGHGRVQFARFQSAVADAVEDGTEAMLAKELADAVAVFGVLGNDAAAGEPPGLPRPDADDLTGIARAEIVKGIETRHARDAGDEQR